MTVPSPKRVFPRPSNDPGVAFHEPPYKRAKTHHAPHSVFPAQPCGDKTTSAPIAFLPSYDQSPRPLTSCASNFNEVREPQVSPPSLRLCHTVCMNPSLLVVTFPVRPSPCLVHQSCRALSRNSFCSLVFITQNSGLIIPDLSSRSVTSKACFRFLSIIECRKVSIMPASLAIPLLPQEETPLQQRIIYPNTKPRPLRLHLRLPTLLPLPSLLSLVLQ